MEMRVASGDEEGKKKHERTALLKMRRPDTVHHLEKKLADKGVLRMERHPTKDLGIGCGPPKFGRGGKFTWEGPEDLVEHELDPVPLAVDERDPNYAGEEIIDEEAATAVVGEVEVAKMTEAKEGVSRIDVQPPLQP